MPTAARLRDGKPVPYGVDSKKRNKKTLTEARSAFFFSYQILLAAFHSM